MNSLKSLCVIIVLSAITYAAYVSLTGSPPADPPPEAAAWQDSPDVELPGDLRGPDEHGHAHGTGLIPGGEAPAFTPQSASSNPAVANPFTASDAMASVASGNSDGATPPYMVPPVGSADESNVPSAYPRTNYPDDPLSGVPGATGAADAAGNVNGSTTQPSDASAVTPPAAGSEDRFAATEHHAAAGAATPASDDPSQQFRKSLETIYRQLDAGKLAEAHLELSQWFDDPQLTAEENQALMQLLDQLAGTVIYSRQHLLEPAYEAKQGDTLERVAEEFHVPSQLLAKINGMSPAQQLSAGQMIKVVRGPFDAVVDLDEFQLSLFLHGRYAGSFGIGIGNDRATPIGEYSVQNKVTNPTYYGADGVIDANDPANPLGEIWIDLGQQLGIHSTSEPQSIGQAGGAGCIRLAPSHAQDVYDILGVGSRVIIRR